MKRFFILMLMIFAMFSCTEVSEDTDSNNSGNNTTQEGDNNQTGDNSGNGNGGNTDNPANFIYVQGATITGAITAEGYTTSSIFNGSKTVTVRDFYMCDHEVTQAEYEKYCTYGGSSPSSTYGKGDNYPAYYVSWYDALVYCNKRSIAEGLTPCYTIKSSTNPTDWGSIPDSKDHANWDSWCAVTCDFTVNGYRLPKEAEWEYAARGGNGLTGYQYIYAGSDTIGNVAWYYGNSSSKAHEVKGKKANGLVLYDMSGNVWEWCWDSYDSGARYLRGGSWYNSADNCAVSSGNCNYAYSRNNNNGFRVVRTVDLSSNSLVGCIVYSDGSISENYDNTKTPIGIVIEVSDEGVATKIVSLTQTSTQWSTQNVTTKATSTTDGVANITAIQSISGWDEKYPAFKWCDDYTDASGNSEWYLLSKNELNQLYIVKDYVNAAIDKIIAGGGTATKLGAGYYWSSSQYYDNDSFAWYQRFSDGDQYGDGKGYSNSVRAVRAF